MFQNSDEVLIRELKFYIDDWGNLNINNKSQLSCTMFFEKCGSLALYDEDLEKIFIIYHKQLQFDTNAGWTLIGIPDKTDGKLSDCAYFCIHDDIFDRIQSTRQDRNIMWGFISNEPNESESHSEATEIHDYNIQNKNRSIARKSTKHTPQRKRQKTVDCRDKSFDDSRLRIVDPTPKLESEE